MSCRAALLALSLASLPATAAAAVPQSATASAASADALATVSERSGFQRTGRYEEVGRLAAAFQARHPDRVRALEFGTTPEGRPMQLLVVTATGAFDAAEARSRGLPVVLVQGGIHAGETPDDALFRELHEEVGLHPQDVRVIASTRGWLRYRLPGRYRRPGQADNTCIGQKQRWYLLQLLADDSAVVLDRTQPQEFDDWQWVSYWYPLGQVITFKREVYRHALKELLPALDRITGSAA